MPRGHPRPGKMQDRWKFAVTRTKNIRLRYSPVQNRGKPVIHARWGTTHAPGTISAGNEDMKRNAIIVAMSLLLLAAYAQMSSTPPQPRQQVPQPQVPNQPPQRRGPFDPGTQPPLPLPPITNPSPVVPVPGPPFTNMPPTWANTNATWPGTNTPWFQTNSTWPRTNLPPWYRTNTVPPILSNQVPFLTNSF